LTTEADFTHCPNCLAEDELDRAREILGVAL
jgi:hypothetical protein